MKTAPRLIALLGAECTGKTTLAEALARATGGLWVPEYLREFCEAHGRTPRREEQALIAETQHLHALAAREQARQEGRPWVFCDTTAWMTSIYSQYVFGDKSLHVRARTLQSAYALTLYCQPDLPWQPDGIQRDGPQTRAAVDRLLQRSFSETSLAVVPIAGSADERLERALAALKRLT